MERYVLLVFTLLCILRDLFLCWGKPRRKQFSVSHLESQPNVCIYMHHSQLQKRERTGTSFLYCLHWKSKHFNWNATEWKATQPSLRVFSRKKFKWDLAKGANFHTNPYNFVACLPNPYKLSILDDIWRAIIFFILLPSKYFYSWLFLVKTLKFIWSFIWISQFF